MSAAPPPPPASAAAPSGRELAAVLGAVAAGGVLGSLLRYQATVMWPNPLGTFPITVLTVNLLGCLVIGVFMVIITELRATHRLVRPFVGTGVLGGFTTFSTYSLDILELIRTGHPGAALGYLSLTAFGAMLAVGAGMVGTRRLAISFGWSR